MKTYSQPKLDVLVIHNSDIITTSNLGMTEYDDNTYFNPWEVKGK